MNAIKKILSTDKFWILIFGLIIGALLGASFHKETIVVREGTAENPAALSSVNLMIDYGDGRIKTWNTVSWNEAMSVLDLMHQVANAKEITLTTKEEKAGTIIESIDGAANDPNQQLRWQYWVDNNYEPRIAGKYYLKPGDIILWKFTKEQSK